MGLPHDMKINLIEKCAAVIIRNERVLVVRKRGTSVFISPGGKIIDGEGQIECLKRELKEELKADLITATPLGTYERLSAFEDNTIRIHSWLAVIEGACEPNAEIEEIRWISSVNTVPLGSVFAECVIPELIKNGYLPA